MDLKKEREHEAANPGPSISEALKQGRPAAWIDPSGKKEGRSCEEDAKRRKVWKPTEDSDDDDLVSPMVIGGDSSDEELVEDRDDDLAGQQAPDLALDTDEEMILSDPTNMLNCVSTSTAETCSEAEAATHPKAKAAGDAANGDEQPNPDLPNGGATGDSPTGGFSEHMLVRGGPNWEAPSSQAAEQWGNTC